MRGVEAEGQQRPHCAGRVKRRPEQVTQRRGELQLEREAVGEAGAGLRSGPSSEASSGSQILIVEESRVKPGLGEQTHGPKHAWEVATLQHKL